MQMQYKNNYHCDIMLDSTLSFIKLDLIHNNDMHILLYLYLFNDCLFKSLYGRIFYKGPSERERNLTDDTIKFVITTNIVKFLKFPW